jgi:hypothetical protein
MRSGAMVTRFSANGGTLSLVSQEQILHTWQVATGKPIDQVALPRLSNVIAAVFSPDGSKLATAGRGSAIYVWEPTSGKLIGQYLGINAGQSGSGLAFSPDGRTLATCNSGMVKLFELTTGKERGIIGGQRGFISSIAFSPDGKRLAMAGFGLSVYVYDLAGDKELREFKGHQGAVTALAFAEDGRRLFSGSSDSTVLAWDTARPMVKSPPTAKSLSREKLESLWTDLGDEDAIKAYRAIWKLAGDPEGALLLLRERIKPVEGLNDQGRLSRLISHLDDDRFRVRARASEELERLGHAAESALRDALRHQLSPESQRRIEMLLARLEGPVTGTEQLTSFRGLEVLEHIGAAEAVRLVEKLAEGAPDAKFTQETKRTLARMAKGGASVP